MKAPELLDYIRRRLQEGASQERIERALLRAGWHERDIQEAFGEAKVSIGHMDQQTIITVEGFAGFWRRFAAYLIDQLAILLVGVTVGILFLSLTNDLMFLVAFSQLGSPMLFLLTLLYFALMESSSKQATLGKMLLGIRVITEPEGHRLSLFRAMLRSLGKLLSAIPLCAGYVMAGFTQKKQALHDVVAGCAVVRYGKSYFWRTVLVGVPCIVLVLAGAGSYIYYVQIPAWKHGFMQSVSTFSQPSETPTMEAQRERVVAEPVEPKRMTEVQYDQLLASQTVSLGSGASTADGPVVFEISNFWDHDQKPSIWIEVRMIPLPNLNLWGGNLARMEIDHVWDRNRKDIYDPDSGFERGFFKRLSFSKEDRPYPHLRAVRDVHLVAGVKEEDIQRVKGTLVLKLPIDIEVLTLDTSNLEKVAAGSAGRASLSEANGSEFSMKYEGPLDLFVSTLAYNESGQQLERSMYSWSTDDKANVTTFQCTYEGEVKKVDVIVASRMVERRYPFLVQK